MYYDLCDSYYSTNKENFFPDEEVDFYIFTNVKPTVARRGQYVFVKDYEGVWPEPTFRKFECILEAIERKEYDRVFYLDADNCFLRRALLRKEFLENDFSIISPTRWGVKYGGMFWGGKTKYVKQFCEYVKRRCDRILEAKELPLRNNDEEYFYWLDSAGFKVTKYSYDEVFDEGGKKWLYQIPKDFQQAHSHRIYIDYGFVRGYAAINYSMKLISVHETHSLSIYGRLENLAEGVYSITWQNPQFPNSLLDLRK
jgi:hypothetical protein